MTASKTAIVETLTAEVRVLMVGSRQVTMSVYGQLDHVEYDEIEPFGRVMPKDAQSGYVYIIGKRAEAGDLVSSWLPSTETGIKRWAASRSSAAAYERSAENEDGRAAQCEKEARELAEIAAKLLGDDVYIGKNDHLDSSFVHCAGYLDAKAAKHDQEAAAHDQEASAAKDEITRLEAARDAAEARHSAARARKEAGESRAIVAALHAKAQDCKTRATVHKANAEAHWTACGEWTTCESREISNAITKAAEWEALPLIVLAGLR